MPTRPEALRLADTLDAHQFDEPHATAAELRRLHAENASLSAALASSCDEQRHELWESGGIAGCERARVAERQRGALLEAYRKMKNVAAGYSNLCDGSAFTRKLEREFEAADAIARAAIKMVEEEMK